jgi:hypothetical protein
MKRKVYAGPVFVNFAENIRVVIDYVGPAVESTTIELLPQFDKGKCYVQYFPDGNMQLESETDELKLTKHKGE